MNEVWNVLTYRDYDFEDGGRQVKGRSMHCYRDSKNDGWPGIEYAKMSIPFGTDAYNMLPQLGAAYEFVFDRRGKVVQMLPHSK